MWPHGHHVLDPTLNPHTLASTIYTRNKDQDRGFVTLHSHKQNNNWVNFAYYSTIGFLQLTNLTICFAKKLTITN